MDDSSSTVFRTKQEEPQAPTTEAKVPNSGTITTEEVPYLDYAVEHHHPFTVDYFKLGEMWNDPMGGFTKEVGTIENYLREQIETGQIENSVPAIKQIFKNMEKMTNIKAEERTVMKISLLAAHVEFLMKADRLKSNLRRYSGYA